MKSLMKESVVEGNDMEINLVLSTLSLKNIYMLTYCV